MNQKNNIVRKYANKLFASFICIVSILAVVFVYWLCHQFPKSTCLAALLFSGLDLFLFFSPHKNKEKSFMDIRFEDVFREINLTAKYSALFRMFGFVLIIGTLISLLIHVK